MDRRLQRTGWPSSPGRAAGSAWPVPGGSPPKARWWWTVDIDETAGKASRRLPSAASRRRPTWPARTTSERLYDTVVAPARAGRHRVPQRGDLSAGRRLHPGHRARGLAPGPAGEPDLGVPVLQVR